LTLKGHTQELILCESARYNGSMPDPAVIVNKEDRGAQASEKPSAVASETGKPQRTRLDDLADAIGREQLANLKRNIERDSAG
jgi:hypothetical protein